MKRRLVEVFLAFCTALVASGAQAIPVLQIYIDGATYDTQTETWVTKSADFDLWVIGDVDAKGTIYDVTLTASFFGLGGGTFTMTPGTTSRVTDPSTPGAPIPAGNGTGSHPVLPNHGIFNDATLHHWSNYSIGDFPLKDSPIADYSGSVLFPTSFPDNGQVNVYHCHTSGWNKVHFDAYGTTINTTNGKESNWKTPFSHDGQVPVQSTSWSAIRLLFEH